MNILLVDDEKVNLMMLEKLLAPQGYNILTAKDGETALKLLDENEVDLVLLDVMLPGISGFDVLKMIRESEKLCALPVILVTALGDHNDKMTGLKLGADDYVVRPYDKFELLTRVKTQGMLSELRRRAEKAAQDALEIKSRFTSMASHELRTPLAIIEGSLAVVLDGSLGPVDPEQRKILEMAKQNIDRLIKLTTSILDFQKLELWKGAFEIKENDVNEMVREIHQLALPLVTRKGLKFDLRLGEDLPRVKCDRDKIDQVLFNLVNNAVKFTEQGGIVIATGRKDNIVEVSVTDTGSGIREEELPRLFQEFSQLESGYEKKKKGSGLGLAISKKIIDAHQGKIWGESEYGKGSTFRFILPIKERRV